MTDNVGKQEREALSGYRAAVAFISADSWDGCSDCIEVLKAARCADMTDPLTSDEIAENLRRIRMHYPPTSFRQPTDAQIAREAAIEECAQLVEHRFALIPTLTLPAAEAVAVALPDAIRALKDKSR